MKRLQINSRKTLLGIMTTLFVLLAGAESAFACHQDPCPTYCEGKGCK
jgi:hypothetical protein